MLRGRGWLSLRQESQSRTSGSRCPGSLKWGVRSINFRTAMKRSKTFQRSTNHLKSLSPRMKLRYPVEVAAQYQLRKEWVRQCLNQNLLQSLAMLQMKLAKERLDQGSILSLISRPSKKSSWDLVSTSKAKSSPGGFFVHRVAPSPQVKSIRKNKKVR